MEHDNIMAPFLFAMNEVYLRDGSRKVKDVLRSKRESGQYCACPPYGYRKDPENKHRLSQEEMGMGMALKVGALSERTCFYVPRSHYQSAADLLLTFSQN